MQVEIKIDKAYVNPKAVVITSEVTDEINNAVEYLSDSGQKVITGFKEERAVILDKSEIIRIYASSGKVYAETEDGEFILKMRIYETLEKLMAFGFVRISNSEIVNLKKIKSFDLSFTGTICITFQNGKTTWASRRYVSKIKQILGV